MSGTMRVLLANMVNGVRKGFEQKLRLVVVGFRVQAAGQKLNVLFGFLDQQVKEMAAVISVQTTTQTELFIKCDDRQVVGELAAEVHAVFFFSSRRRHTSCSRDWSSDVCSSDLPDAVSTLRRCVEETRDWVETHGRFDEERSKRKLLDLCAEALTRLAGGGSP